jgi:hypothetical protein
MNPEKLLSRHSLDNGITLNLWDCSRPVAGDRWYVALEVRIAIPVNQDTLPPELRREEAAVAAALGPQLIFSQRDERTFIAAQEVPDLLKEMAARALDLAPRYFGHPDFARKLIRQKYAQHLEKRRGQGF